MKKLLVFLKDYKKESVLGPLFKLLEASFELIVPLVMAAIIDTGVASEDRPYIMRMCLALVLLAVIGLICSITAQYFAAKAAVGFATGLRHALFSHIGSLSFSEMDTVGTSTLITRMTSDVNQVQNGVNLVLRLFLRSPFIVFGAMIMAFTIDVKAALIFVVTIPLLSVVVFGIMFVSIPLYKKVQNALDTVLGITRENLTGSRVIRAFNKEEDEIRHFRESNELLTRVQLYVGKISALMNPLTYVIINGAIVALVWTGAVRVDNGLIMQENMDRIRFLEGESVFYLGLGIPEYKKTTEDGRTYEFGIMPWLGENAADNMLCRSVSRYIGLNRSLAEPGNEKKLEDALKFLDFISTTEGQQALLVNINDIPSLHGNEIPEESPYRDVADMIYSGRTAPVVYIGWEQPMIPMAQEIRRMMRGEIGTEELLMAFDSMNESMLAGESKEIFGTAVHTLTLEKTAQLVAVAEGRAVDADCALISLNGGQGSHWGNRFGLGWYLYEGGIDAEAVNLIRPVSSSISVLEMTGAQIRELRDAGFDIDGNGNPYPYLLFTKGDADLEDETVYRLAVSSAELTEEMQTQATKTEVSPAGAIEEYVRSLGTVSGETIVWEADETP